MGHVRSCRLYPRNNGKPLRGVEQDGDMIHGVLEASLWKQFKEWISGVESECTTIRRLFTSPKQKWWSKM